ncbi:2-hydroxy-6-oxononadienedioate/2-hydroxy-6- oxononatrienedioate hydrolase [Kordia sp. SMS9]|uniref:alpha/beta fold hydrolase n=1 Tax=Kordia sp. SMS9 TaxID=2282170 RepID=UPI000E0DB41C|nr:alpha/beta hydrolase [Kordia sp. SMS9]AXG72038.1 2-hydroxy-6-oxononadienedioate/2-hydroxy-6- oxononatrienedioate hydrolase [Kordia sp. SMS9]
MSQTASNANPEPPVQVPKPILYTGRFLQFFSTTLAAKYAKRLFITPIKYKMPKREFHMDKASTQTMMHVPKIEKDILVYSYGESDKKIVLAHGWSGRGTQLVKIADHFVNLGYQTISFDATSHGKLKGNQSSLLEFIESIKELDKQYGPFEFAIGHSLGGMSLLNAIHDGMQVQKLVTIGAGDLISDIISDFIEALTLKPIVATKMKANLDRIYGSDINAVSASNVAKKVDIPTLVIHDENDGDVPVKAAHAIYKALPKGSIHITEGLGHRRILGNTAVIEKIEAFLL